MFEFFKRWAFPAPTLRNSDVVFWVDLPEIAEPASAPRQVSSDGQTICPQQAARSNPVLDGVGLVNQVALTRDRQLPRELPQVSHRERLLAMRLEYLKLCPPARCRELAAVGVQTAGDVLFGDPRKIAGSFRNAARAERAIRRYRAAIKLAAAIDTMMPRDALLLVTIHRRSVAGLARESAAQLHRDLERFSLSSRGSKLVGRRGIPSLRRVRGWVATCREIAASAPAPSQLVRQAA